MPKKPPPSFTCLIITSWINFLIYCNYSFWEVLEMYVALQSHVSRCSRSSLSPASTRSLSKALKLPWFRASDSASSLWPLSPIPWRPHSSMHLMMEVRKILFFAICFSTSSESLFWMINYGSLIIFTKSSIFVLESRWYWWLMCSAKSVFASFQLR